MILDVRVDPQLGVASSWGSIPREGEVELGGAVEPNAKPHAARPVQLQDSGVSAGVGQLERTEADWRRVDDLSAGQPILAVTWHTLKLKFTQLEFATA
eukprot:767258-Hanusia_phi.AAC.3